MKFKILVLALLLVTTSALADTRIIQNRLEITYAVKPGLCQHFYELYSVSAGCNLKNEDCFAFQWGSESSPSFKKIAFRQLAVNQYGYTEVYVAHPSDKPYSIVYLNGFQGDRHPRLIETWKIDTEELFALTERVPRPLVYEQWVKGDHEIQRSTFASEFDAILSNGEKLSDDWSPVWMPFFRVKDSDYAITRECAGNWEYGGYYDCDKIIKLTVKRIATNKTATPVCEFAKPNRP